MKYNKIGPDVVDVFCETRGFSFVREGYREGEAVVWVINDEGMLEYYTLSHVKKVTEDGLWITMEEMAALEIPSEICLEEQLTITTSP